MFLPLQPRVEPTYVPVKTRTRSSVSKKASSREFQYDFLTLHLSSIAVAVKTSCRLRPVTILLLFTAALVTWHSTVGRYLDALRSAGSLITCLILVHICTIMGSCPCQYVGHTGRVLLPSASATDCQLCFLDVHNLTGSVDIGRDKRLVPGYDLYSHSLETRHYIEGHGFISHLQ